MKLQHSVNQRRADQFFIGLPISIVRAMAWKKGDEITPHIQGKDMILLRKFGKKPSDAKNTPRLYKHEEEGDYDE